MSQKEKERQPESPRFVHLGKSLDEIYHGRGIFIETREFRLIRGKKYSDANAID
jgi:hypothetical protein